MAATDHRLYQDFSNALVEFNNDLRNMLRMQLPLPERYVKIHESNSSMGFVAVYLHRRTSNIVKVFADLSLMSMASTDNYENLVDILAQDVNIKQMIEQLGSYKKIVRAISLLGEHESQEVVFSKLST